MSSSLKVAVSGTGILVLLVATILWINPNLRYRARAADANSISNAVRLPYNATANGPYTVKGNAVVGANGQQYIIHGIARDGLEYNCSGEGPLDQQHLAYLGTGVNTTTGTYWGANTVRLPLSEGFWLHGAPGYPCSAAQYQATVKRVVDTLTVLKLNVLLDLQWTDAGGQSGQGGGPWAMPDVDSTTFWQQVAPVYKDYVNVLFEAYNEPHPANWACWTGSCTMTGDRGYSDDCHCTKSFTYTSVGMQDLVNTIRGTGANNLIVVGGMNWGYDLSQLATYKLSDANIVYDTHPYPYTDKAPNTWDAAFGNPSRVYPVISAESGEYDCDSTYMGKLLAYFDARQIGWSAFSWAMQGNTCTYPLLIADYNGTPSAGYGLAIYQHLHRYAPTATPVSGVWYFAEGHVGGTFTEYLSINNPDPMTDCPITVQYVQELGQIITKSVTVTRSSRLTESVNADMGVPATQATAVAVAAIVSVNPASACNGVVVERPQYFAWHGIKSGNDVMGATHLGKTFYFADIPTNNGYTSYLTVLNPPTNDGATITATYYANGQVVGKPQTIGLNMGQRGTLFPSSNALPTHVAAMITSTQPIVVERTDYFSNVASGNAGIVSGGTSVIGTQALSHDWLFAEGYTGGKFQEYLAIANLDSTANTTATVTITLQLGDGSTKSVTMPLPAMTQTLWDVNARVPANAVSAEVTTTGAAIVVQREMFFQYTHTIGNNGFSLAASGGTDIIGQVGPASVNSYTFAEGYANVGYNEWLTLQNPMGSDETVTITLNNGYGRGYSVDGVLIRAHTRTTIDIAALVRQYLLKTGSDPRYSCAVAMTVQGAPDAAFVAERPMYWNTGNSQGGSAVLGYVGA